jgi:hypothetical protein
MDLVNRPIYHFAPLANWMNDPKWLDPMEGKYHLFYQTIPTAHTGSNALGSCVQPRPSTLDASAHCPSPHARRPG